MKKILVVEDDSALALNLAAFLQLAGYEVHHAADGPAAVEAARKFRPDLLLLDALIPKVDGFEVCRLLRADEKTKSVKIIMVTGLGQMGDVEKALSCGANVYLIKPFDQDRLLKKIEKALL
jgi:two-component system, OmpR family, response regulator ResD